VSLELLVNIIGQSFRMTCDDDCGRWFSGTWFELRPNSGGHVQCDYNTVGWDVKINSAGNLECHDTC